jgi:hypothetical protein
MAEELQKLPDIPKITIVNGKVTEVGAPVPSQVNDGVTKGNPTIASGARGVTDNTMVNFSNNNLSHVCNFVDDMRKNIELKKFIKAQAKTIREAIRKILKLLGLTDPTGQTSWLATTLKKIAREIKNINDNILKPILDFQQYVIAYIAKLREIVTWILSLPAKFLALLQDCLARLIKSIGAVFSDIGSGLSEGFSEGPSDYEEIIKEGKNLVSQASNTLRLTIAATAGAANIVGAATIGLLVPTSPAELAAADKIITAYEAPADKPIQKTSHP